MAWKSQTLAELIEKVEQDFNARFLGSSAPLRRSVIKIQARVWGGIVFLLTLLLEWVYRNNFAHLCDEDQVPMHGIPIGIRQTSAFNSTGFVLVTGGTPGESIIQGTIINDTTGDLQFQTAQENLIPEGGEILVQITSLLAGLEYNQEEGTVLQFEDSSEFWDDDVVVQEGGISGGDDIEDMEDLRARILYKKQNPPQGGAEADYVGWATSQPNVTAAFILDGYPQVNNVQIVCADYDKVALKPPQPPTVSDTDIQRVHEYITAPVRKPLTSIPVTSSCIPAFIIVKARIEPNTSANRTAATKELSSLMIKAGIPNATINDETVNATIAKVNAITGVGAIEIFQDNTLVDAITLGYQKVAWLQSASFEDVV